MQPAVQTGSLLLTLNPSFGGGEKRLEFVVVEWPDESPDEFVVAVQRFLQLSVSDRDLAAPYVFENYTQIREAVPRFVDLEIGLPRDVWSHVRPAEICVSRRHRRDKAIYVQIEAECSGLREGGNQPAAVREARVALRVEEVDHASITSKRRAVSDHRT